MLYVVHALERITEKQRDRLGVVNVAKITSDIFEINMDNGKVARFWMEDSDMYYGEIRDECGDLEAATLTFTPADVHKWIERNDQ